MEDHPGPTWLSLEDAEAIALKAGRVFTPRTPVSTRELFAGRWGQIKSLVDTASQIGLHAVVYGERGVGKTSLANVIPITLKVFDDDLPEPQPPPRIAIRTNSNSTDTFSSVWVKVFDELSWIENEPVAGFRPTPGQKRVTLRDALGLGDQLTIEDVRRALAQMPRSVFVIDEFDRLAKKQTAPFTDLIKALSDGSIETTIVIVGVAETVDGLVRDHASISRALVQIHVPRMKVPELMEIISKAESNLGMVFERAAGERVAILSQGLPHYTHLVGLHAVRTACARLSRLVTTDDVTAAFDQAAKLVDHTMSALFTEATHSGHAGALYEQVLLACAVAAAASGTDSVGYFQPASVVEPLSMILDRRIDIPTFNRHLVEFTEDKRGRVLERIGRPRVYRYRFRDPLMPPYVLMRGVSRKLIDADAIATFVPKGPKEDAE